MADQHKYKILDKLGEGGFGVVFLIQDDSVPPKKLALKVMNMIKMCKEEVELAQQEIQLLRDLKHDHVLAYEHTFVEDTNLCIVTEYCPNGDLSEYIEERHGTKLEEPRLIEWFRQITSAIAYIHSKNIIHRDLKAANIFLDANMDCKLGDFGVARILESATDLAQTQVGTYHYMSPELFQGIKYNVKTDIWSLAVMIYELAALEKPFDALFLPLLIMKITRGETPDIPDGYRPEFGALLRKMLEKDPANRPSASDMLKDPLFAKATKPKPMPNLKTALGAAGGDFSRYESFMITLSETSRKKPGVKQVIKNKPRVIPEEDDEGTGDAVPGSDPIMELVTRTLSGMGHNTLKPAGRNHLQHQADLLKRYIMSVLDDNEEIFRKALSQLDTVKDSEELEERLIRVLGHEKYGMCGVQLLHYKNFSYNMRSN